MRRIFKVLLAAAVLVSCVYLAVFVRGLLFEAQMSLGIIRQREPGLLAQIVNKENYVPPSDGLLRPTQIMMLHEISRQLDSLAAAKATQSVIDAQLVRMLNRFTISTDEYRWIRATATRLMLNRRSSTRNMTDSANSRRLSMMLTDVDQFRRFYRDSLDKGIL